MSSPEKPSDCIIDDQISNVLIVGLGKSGLSSAKYLTKYKNCSGDSIKVSIYDKFKSIEEQKKILYGLGVENFYTGEMNLNFYEEKTHILLSPGVDPREIEMCLNQCKLINDISLFLEYLANSSLLNSSVKTIGITGTNGKTTTCSLVEHLFIKAGYRTKLAGNIGQSPLDLIDMASELDIVILELSSFQLWPFKTEGFANKLDVGIFLNFSEDHLDIHSNLLDYFQSKLAILHSSKRTIVSRSLDKIPTNFNDVSFGKALAKKPSRLNYKLDTINTKKFIIDDKGFKVSVDCLNLPGEHNQLNVMAAIASFRCLENSFDKFEGALSSFNGIPHRLEWIKNIYGIDFYNDSKATNVASTVAGLESFSNKNIFLIAGGDSKNQSLSPLKKYFEKNTISLLLIGRDAELFVRSFEAVSLLKITMCNSMKDAVSQAFKQAEKGDIILLSPACASYDMYQNYIERGDDFKHLVEEL